MDAAGLVSNLAVALTLVLVVTAQPAVGASPPQDATKDEYNVTDQENGLSGGLIKALWNRDADQSGQVETGGDYNGNSGYIYERGNESRNVTTEDKAETLKFLLAASDTDWTEPPKAPVVWNRNEWNSYSSEFSSDESSSIHPKSAKTENKAWIKDAHATYFALNPSTRVYDAGNTPTVHVRNQGNATALVDYRIALPADDTDKGDGKTVTWTIETHSIDEVCLVKGASSPSSPSQNPLGNSGPCNNRVDGEVVGTTSPTHTPRIQYSLGATGNEDVSLSVVAEIELKTKKVVKERETETYYEYVDTDPDPDETDIERVKKERVVWEKSVKHPKKSLVVSDTIDVTAKQAQLTKSRVSPEGLSEAEYDVSITDDPWSTIRVGNASITSRWRFTTARDTQWDTVVEADGTGETATEPPIPVQTYAAPVKSSIDAERDFKESNWSADSSAHVPQIQDEQTKDPRIRANLSQAVSDNLTLQRADRRYYNQSTRVIFRYSGGSLDDLTYVGMVYGETKPFGGAVSYGTVERRTADLSLTVVDVNATDAAFKVTLTENQTGDPIRTAGRPGYVTVRGVKKNTNSSGEAVYVLNRTGHVTEAKYHPGGWWELDKEKATYQAADSTVQLRDPTVKDGQIRATFVYSLPLAILLWIVNHLLENTIISTLVN